jgi:tetratricopeptide (TPR) repeat protein
MADETAATQSVRINLKLVLLLVIIVCAAIVGIAKLRARLEARMTMISRGPLHPLTPPITADKVALMAELRARKFDQLEATLTSYQSAAEKAVTQEANMVHAFAAFYRDDPTFEAPLKEWVSRSPKSYAAHLARAVYLNGKGWDARGAKWASETSTEQFARMKDDFAKSANEARSALAINPKLAMAYAVLISEQKAGDGIADCMRETKLGLKQVPASFEIRDATMSCLRPRWGGSYPAMKNFAAQAQAQVHVNPLLKALKGFADLDRGEVMNGEDKYDVAIGYYSRAIAKGGDYWSFYNRRGESLMRLNRYAEALEDLGRADQLMPQSPQVLESIAYVLLVTGKPSEAMTQLNLAESIEGPVAYDQQLRSEIVTAMSQNLRTTGASGN